jgi:hypothetical protein
MAREVQPTERRPNRKVSTPDLPDASPTCWNALLTDLSQGGIGLESCYWLPPQTMLFVEYVELASGRTWKWLTHVRHAWNRPAGGHVLGASFAKELITPELAGLLAT